MNPANFNYLYSLVEQSGYLLVFLLMVVEGPLVTIAAAAAASFGIFNIAIIFFLSLLGDLVGDLIYFVIGRVGNIVFIENYEKRYHLKSITVRKLKRKLIEHFGKTMFLIKFTPVLTTVGLILAGTLKIKTSRFVWYSLIITLPRTIFFTSIGFYFGLAVTNLFKYFKIEQYVVLVILLIALLIYIYRKKIFKKRKKAK